MSRKTSGRVRNRNSRISNRQFDESAYNNGASWRQYHDKLTELAISMFEWKNLPDGIDYVFMERILFYRGAIIFFYDEALEKYLALPYTTQGQFDVYNAPIRRRAYANNGYQNADLNQENSVIIFNNLLRMPSTNEMRVMAKKLYKIDRIIDVNINAQKTPVLILCDENQRLTMKNLYMQYDGNEPFIFGDSSQLSSNVIKSINTDAPFIADRLIEIKTQIWNEALTYLGISNINYMKKERMITDEVVRNQGGTIANRYSRLEARRQACRMINEMFGLDIWCDFREDYQLAEPENDTTNMTESEDMGAENE